MRRAHDVSLGGHGASEIKPWRGSQSQPGCRSCLTGAVFASAGAGVRDFLLSQTRTPRADPVSAPRPDPAQLSRSEPAIRHVFKPPREAARVSVNAVSHSAEPRRRAVGTKEPTKPASIKIDFASLPSMSSGPPPFRSRRGQRSRRLRSQRHAGPPRLAGASGAVLNLQRWRGVSSSRQAPTSEWSIRDKPEPQSNGLRHGCLTNDPMNFGGYLQEILKAFARSLGWAASRCCARSCTALIASSRAPDTAGLSGAPGAAPSRASESRMMA